MPSLRSSTLLAFPVSRFLMFSALVFTLNSCIKEDFNVSNFALYNAKPGIAIPLINSSLDIHDIYQFDTTGWLLKEDNNRFMTLIYEKSEVFAADSFLKISNQSLKNQKYIFTLDNSIPLGDSTFDTYITKLDFVSTDKDIYDTLYVKSGSLDITLSSNLNMKGKMVFSIPEATKNGKMLVSQINYPGNPNNNINLNIDLTGYKFIFTHQNKSNILTTVCKVMAYNDGSKNNSPYNVSLNVNLNNIKLTKLYGYFSSRSFKFIDFMSVSLFGGIKQGETYIEDPSLYLLFHNSVGIPVKLDILSFSSHSDVKTPHDLPLTGMPKIINIPSPPRPGSETHVSYLIDKSNSNLKDAINLSPTGFNYDVKGSTAPIPVIQNFIFDTSKIKLDVKMEMPLNGWLKNYIMEDTFDFSIDNLEMFESLQFNLLADNGFPLESSLQLYFLNVNDKITDSLFVNSKDLMRSAFVDITSGKVTKASSRVYTVIFDRKRLDNLLNTKKMLLKASIYTNNKGKNSVKIYSDYSIGIKFSALARLKTN